MCIQSGTYVHLASCDGTYFTLQLMSQVLGVFQDPSSGLVCLIKEEMLSFMYPALSADCLALEGHLNSGTNKIQMYSMSGNVPVFVSLR